MEAMFQYVLDQFYAVYQPDQPFDIHYGLNGTSRIQIKPSESSFFENTAPFPNSSPIYYAWQDKKIPFWFETAVKDKLVHFMADQAIIPVDIIANSFYFLSGWQEYYSTVRDKYGRFPYAASLQKKYQCITIPVVNYYFDILKAAIEQIYQIQLKPVFAPTASFTTCLTHDIDNCQTAWRTEGLKALRQGKWAILRKLLRQKITGRDNWANVPEIMQIVQDYRANSTFFFLANNKKYTGIANADYDIAHSRYQKWLKLLRQHNFEVGVHGSHITANQSGQLRAEMQKIALDVWGNRFHYLRFEPQTTPYLLDEAGINYDSTLGFSEHFGFRHGTCFPFRLFDFKTQRAFKFREIPLQLMDATLHHPHYLQLQSEEVLPAITPMLQEIKKFNGCFTWLWHNENFSLYNIHNGPVAFHQIMSYLQEQNAGFKTLGQVNESLYGHNR